VSIIDTSLQDTRYLARMGLVSRPSCRHWQVEGQGRGSTGTSIRTNLSFKDTWRHNESGARIQGVSAR
jgi:hypothetical protein